MDRNVFYEELKHTVDTTFAGKDLAWRGETAFSVNGHDFSIDLNGAESGLTYLQACELIGAFVNAAEDTLSEQEAN